ncbi:hypothetical protein BT96DRAFT_933839 [Gymnopus androsaceus JB14]|uniref:Uncharacterized protein n=1 Tax=Gymnopus androsaceus JB14 TaxID=1447944 RepID=A0A6A4I4T0_9AGAR|nr:hypothetical protein BT96DRAFT_933839 [Gymnopus androsaceus JB14]
MATTAIEKLYTSLLSSISQSSPNNLTELVQKSLSDASTETRSNPENRRMQWEFLIRRDLFTHAALGANDEGYYNKLESWLDLALVFTELSFTDPSYTFTLLSELLETQTIPSCSKIFDWVEERKERLIVGMIPQKGKALVCLRMLNDLLRRLSKAERETVLFSGRILTFLSQVFPLGERSGVNLRDSFYQTFWSLQLPFSKPPVFASPLLAPPQGWTFAQFQDAVDKVLPVIKEATAKERAMMGAGSRSTATLRSKHEHDEKEDSEGNEMDYFFAKFLTSPELLDLEIADTHFRRQFLLQLLILLTHLLQFTKAAKPGWMNSKNRSLHMPGDWCLDDALLLPAEKNANTNTSTAASASADKSSNSKTTIISKETTKKPESTSTSSTQPTQTTGSTSSSTPTIATATTSTSETDPVRWTNVTIARTIEELRQTQPPPSSSSGSSSNGLSGLSGRSFAETVQVILEREKGWVKWKNDLCDAGVFEKGAWEAETEIETESEGVNGEGEAGTKKRKLGMYEATRSVRARTAAAVAEKKDWGWNLGTEALTEVWEMGYRELYDLERGFSPGSPHDFLRKLDLEDRKIEMRTKTLRAQQERKMKMQAEAAAAKEREAKALKDAETKSTSKPDERDQDVEMKPPSPPPTASATAPAEDLIAKIENPPGLSLLPSSSAPIVAPSAHPSLPPKPGSTLATPVKPDLVPSSTSPGAGPAASSVTAGTSVVETATTAVPAPPPQASVPLLPPLPRDEQIIRAEETKHRISWLALRSARDSSKGHLMHFGKIGSGDVRLLVEEIDKAEAQAQAEAEGAEKANGEEGEGKMVVDNDGLGGDGEVGEGEGEVEVEDGRSGEKDLMKEEKMVMGVEVKNEKGASGNVDTEGDVKME